MGTHSSECQVLSSQPPMLGIYFPFRCKYRKSWQLVWDTNGLCLRDEREADMSLFLLSHRPHIGKTDILFILLRRLRNYFLWEKRHVVLMPQGSFPSLQSFWLALPSFKLSVLKFLPRTQWLCGINSKGVSVWHLSVDEDNFDLVKVCGI